MFSKGSKWLTDLVDIYRTQDVSIGSLTRKEKINISENVPCRVYRSNAAKLAKFYGVGNVSGSEMIAVKTGTDLSEGDFLVVKRGGVLGKWKGKEERYVTGRVQDYYEPFGGVAVGLEHTQAEVTLEMWT